jgi:hypothetical protein
MGSTAQSTNMTPSTFVGGITNGAQLFMQQVSSSGAYFNVGDAKDIIIVATNASTLAGAIFIEPGSSQWAGSLGMAYSTTAALYSTATAPYVMALGVSSSTYLALGSTTGSIAVLGPFDSARVKSTSGNIFMVPRLQRGQYMQPCM